MPQGDVIDVTAVLRILVLDAGQRLIVSDQSQAFDGNPGARGQRRSWAMEIPELDHGAGRQSARGLDGGLQLVVAEVQDWVGGSFADEYGAVGQNPSGRNVDRPSGRQDGRGLVDVAAAFVPRTALRACQSGADPARIDHSSTRHVSMREDIVNRIADVARLRCDLL